MATARGTDFLTGYLVWQRDIGDQPVGACPLAHWEPTHYATWKEAAERAEALRRTPRLKVLVTELCPVVPVLLDGRKVVEHPEDSEGTKT